ncbi:MAG: hypothetical protein ACFFCS_03870 [Candidatus Hodarchaeota archaeon]
MIREKEGLTKRNETIVLAVVVAALVLLPLFYFLPTYQNLAGGKYEKRVLAFYYTWYGNTTAYFGEVSPTSWAHWPEGGHQPWNDPMDIGATNHPTLNQSNVTLYDSCDPDAMRFHMDMATYAGIDSFIATWWGQTARSNYNFIQLLNVTEMYGYDMEHTVYFETVQERFRDNNTACVAELYGDLSYIVNNYGNHSKFLKVFDEDMGIYRPVIFIYSTTARPSIANWTTVVNYLHGNGSYPFLIADLGGPRAVPQDMIPLFDGFHIYNPLGVYREEPENAIKKFESLVISSRIHGKLACVTTIAGYDDSNIGREPPRPILDRNNGGTYNLSWDVACKTQPDWALICSFNEWHEGSEIEPSLEDGYFYINETKRHTAIFKSWIS